MSEEHYGSDFWEKQATQAAERSRAATAQAAEHNAAANGLQAVERLLELGGKLRNADERIAALQELEARLVVMSPTEREIALNGLESLTNGASRRIRFLAGEGTVTLWHDETPPEVIRINPDGRIPILHPDVSLHHHGPGQTAAEAWRDRVAVMSAKDEPATMRITDGGNYTAEIPVPGVNGKKGHAIGVSFSGRPVAPAHPPGVEQSLDAAAIELMRWRFGTSNGTHHICIKSKFSLRATNEATPYPGTLTIHISTGKYWVNAATLRAYIRAMRGLPITVEEAASRVAGDLFAALEPRRVEAKIKIRMDSEFTLSSAAVRDEPTEASSEGADADT